MNQALVEKKIHFFQDIIQKTQLNIQKNKNLDILGIIEVNACITVLNMLSIKLNENLDNLIKNTTENIINNLQNVNNELVNLLKVYGTDSLEDLLIICFGNINSIITSEEDNSKFELLKKYFHPTSYKIIVKKEEGNTEKTDKHDKKKDKGQKKITLDDYIHNLDCILYTEKNFHMKIYGIKLYIYHPTFSKNIVITGILDDIILNFISNNIFINMKKQQILDNMPLPEDSSFQNFVDSLTLKEFLIYNYSDIYNIYAGQLTQYKLLKQKSL